MEYRSIDIARKLNISTSTLRIYEDMGIVPPVKRTDSGYRIFTQVHLDYFICIKKMRVGFSLEFIGDLLKEYMNGNIDKSLWMITKSQSGFYEEKIKSEKIISTLLENLNLKNPNLDENNKRLMTINELSKITNISVTTLRYWENRGLIKSVRGKDNNYRLFSSEQIREIPIIYALKHSLKLKYTIHSIEMLKKELENFDYNELNTKALVDDIRDYMSKVNLKKIKSISAFYEFIAKYES